MGEPAPGQRRLVQTSSVVVLKAARCNSQPPPSPPSPSLSAPESLICEPIVPLSLNPHVGTVTATPPSLSTTPPPAPASPPPAHGDNSTTRQRRLRQATHVLNTEALALRNLTTLYETDEACREGFDLAVDAITSRRAQGGKLVITGVGKSGHLGRKLCATFQSLGVPAVFLHPTEALHGDMGLLSPRDAVLVITFSGRTPELTTLVAHLASSHALVLLTAHTRAEACELLQQRPDAVLLPAPIPEPEAATFGVPAPTTSITVALGVGHALALAVADELHHSVASVFARNHPGGAIGQTARQQQQQQQEDL